MAVFKCKMCGGDLEIQEGLTICECEYCGTKQTLPALDNEKKLNLFNRANRLRLNSEFDKAASIYENIIAEFPEEAEGYWGLVLCNYGIEYVDDPATAKKIPTCHRAAFESVTNDENYELALEYADVVSQKIYRDEAREIDRIMSEILSISKNEEPYDIFICYKETDTNGSRTIDSVIAQEVYEALTDNGYRVFFSRISLEDKIGKQYEPYIFAALNSAKVMLAFGTKYEHYHAVWVKNEWSRFLKLMAKDKSKSLVPCYKDMDAYDMPDEFKPLQAQDMGKVGAIQDLLRGIEKLFGSEKVKETVVVSNNVRDDVSPLLKRAFMFLEDSEWKNADEYFEKVLDIDPENAQAYLGKLMFDLKINKESGFSTCCVDFVQNKNYKKIIAFGDDALKNRLKEILSKIQAHLEATKGFVIENNEVVRYTGSSADAVIPKGITSIGPNAFNASRKLSSVIIPDSVTSIGDRAFKDCESLESITIPDSVTSIGEEAFSGCRSLASITIPNSVTSIGGDAFYCCTSLASIRIPDSVTSIGKWAFYGCERLASITIPEGVTSIGEYAFSICTSLVSITIPNSVTSIGKKAFSSCKSLASITIPDSVTSIGGWAFEDFWKSNGLCSYCGGKIKGFLNKKCVKCGKSKDY